MTFLPDTAVARLQRVATWPEFATDRYVVTGEIGRGGMGAVYLAHDQLLARDVAIKVSTGIGSEHLERMLQGEARILARLEHPGIVPVHDIGRLADGRLFYVMNRARGSTLREHLAKTPPLGERLGVFERICDAVAFAHASGIVHRDLTPDNVIVGEFGQVLVLDWGLARLANDGNDGMDEAGMVAGTRGFMSPEQASGVASAVTVRADVYGLGAILHMLLTGEPPAAGTPVMAAHVARPLRAICHKALASDPDARYGSVRAMAADVARYRAGEKVHAHRETVVERVGRLGRTYRTPILLVLAYILMRAAVAWFAGR